MATPQRHLSEVLLQSAIKKQVANNLGQMNREMNDFVKEMSFDDAREARLMILEMVHTACEEYCAEMKARLEGKKR